MNILIDIRLLSGGGFSGIKEYTRSLIDNLLLVDTKNKYQFFYNGFRRAPLSDQWLSDSRITIHQWSWPNKAFDFSNRIFGRPRIDKYFNPDVVFSPHFNILSLSRAPKILTIHDLSFIHHPDFFSWRQHFWHWLQNVQQQVQRAEHIIAVSDFTKSDLVDYFGVPPEKITRIYSGINQSFFLDTRDHHKTSSPAMIPTLKPHILFLGTLEPRKNVIAAVRAFEILKGGDRFKDLQLLIAGPLGWLYQKFLRDVSRSKYSSDIKFIGSISSSERASLYRSAAVFIYPSFFEGFGFPPLEAQVCGTPVVASNRTSLPEILGDSAVLVDPWRVGDLAEAIQEILENQSWRERLIKSGLENVKRFSWQKTAQATLKIFQCNSLQ